MTRKMTYEVKLTGSIEFERTVRVEAKTEHDAMEAARCHHLTGGWDATHANGEIFIRPTDAAAIEDLRNNVEPAIIGVVDPAEAAVREAGNVIADWIMKPVVDWIAATHGVPVGSAGPITEAQRHGQLIARWLADVASARHGEEPLPQSIADAVRLIERVAIGEPA